MTHHGPRHFGEELMRGETLRFFSDEVAKLAGLPRPPAMGGATTKLLASAAKPTVTGATGVTAGLAKATSPAALVPPPPIKA